MRTLTGISMAKWCLMFLLFCPSIWADWGPSSCADTTVISSLPHTISSSGCYRFSGNLNAGAGSGLLIAASNVSVFFEGDTIWFGNSTTDNTYGLQIDAYKDSIYICGPGAIISNAQVTGSDTSWSSRCYQVYGYSKFVHVDTLNLTANGGNGKCMLLTGGYGQKITRCRMTNHSKWYKERCDYDAACVKMSGSWSAIHGVDDFYHLYLEDNVIDSAHHSGFFVSGVVKAINNEIHISAINLRYPAGGDACHNSSNAYCFNVRNCSVMVVGDTVHVSEFKDNVGYAYDEYYGSDGLFEVERTQGTADTSIMFVNNKGYIHRGWDPEYELMARGIAKIRPEGKSIKYVHFKHDSCWVYSRKVLSLADSASEWSSYGNLATGFYIIDEYAGVTNTGNVIESCYVKAVTLLDTTDGDYNIRSNVATGLHLFGTWQTGSWAIRDNVFESNHTCIRLGKTDDGPEGWDSVYNNIFNMVDTGAGREYLFFHGDGWLVDDNDFLDNDVNPDSVWDKTFWYGAAPTNARIRRTLDLYVEGNNSLPVSGCSVFVWNDYLDSTVRSQAVSAGVTGGDGYYHPVVSIYYGTVGAGDSLNASYCDFRFKAFYHTDPDSASTTYCVKAHQYTDTLTLPNTAGQNGEEVSMFLLRRLRLGEDE